MPVIMPPDVRNAMSFLADLSRRKEAGIVHGNPFMFPNSGMYLWFIGMSTLRNSYSNTQCYRTILEYLLSLHPLCVNNSHC